MKLQRFSNGDLAIISDDDRTIIVPVINDETKAKMLIAAPAMLAALKGIVAEIDKADTDVYDTLIDIHGWAGAAIAAAEPEEDQ